MKRQLRVCLLLIAVFALPGLVAADSFPIKVKGQGFFQNLKHKNAVAILAPEDSGEPVPVTYNLLEDALYLLDNELKSQGYFQPSFKLEWPNKEEHFPEDVVWEFATGFQTDITDVFPLDEATIIIEPDIRFYFKSFDFVGFPEELGDIEGYFFDTSTSIKTRATRFYSPVRWRQGLNAIIANMEAMGYCNARLVRSEAVEDLETGEVTGLATFEKGPLCYVRSFDIVLENPDSDLEVNRTEGSILPGRVFKPAELREVVFGYRQRIVQQGYPEANIVSRTTDHPVSDERLEVDIVLRIEPGPKVTIGDIRFEGGEDFKQSTLKRHIVVKPGEILNNEQVRIGQRRLSAMGMFNRVTVDYEKNSPEQWDIVYTLEPRPKHKVELLGGVGSYDGPRGGFVWNHANLWGSGQRGELKFVYSPKTSQVNYRHYMPQIFGEKWQVFADLEYLNREEVSFDRVEYKTSVGTRTLIESMNIRLTSQYKYEFIRDEDVGDLPRTGPTNIPISSLEFRATKDETDNILSPNRGYRAAIRTEFASPWLGGDVEYASIEFPASWHFPLGDATVLHAGFKNGGVFTWDDRLLNIPINKRFFLGGENTLRGYQRGEAAPRNEVGEEIGSELYFLGQIELEQRLFGSFAAVAFFDAAVQAANIDEWSNRFELYSVGIGVRWNTILGPIRLEYGHNLNPRPLDPSGTLHFALGTPF